MIPLIQSRTGPMGTCFRTSLAMILNLREDEVPDFADADQDPEVNRWLAKRGLHYREIPIRKGTRPPHGWHIITGISPRGGQHAVVGYNGVMQADPHPIDGSRHGLDKEECWGILEKIGRGVDVTQKYKPFDRYMSPEGVSYYIQMVRPNSVLLKRTGSLATLEVPKKELQNWTYLPDTPIRRATDSARRVQLHRALDAVMDSADLFVEKVNGWHIVQDSAGNYVCTKPGYVEMNIKTLQQARRMCENGGTKKQ